MINVIASISVKPGKSPEFLAIFKANVPAVKAEKGCIEYSPTVDVNADLPVQVLDKNVVTIIEKWNSLDDLKAHLKAPHMLAYKEKVKEMVENVSIKVLGEEAQEAAKDKAPEDAKDKTAPEGDKEKKASGDAEDKKQEKSGDKAKDGKDKATPEGDKDKKSPSVDNDKAVKDKKDEGQGGKTAVGLPKDGKKNEDQFSKTTLGLSKEEFDKLSPQEKKRKGEASLLSKLTEAQQIEYKKAMEAKERTLKKYKMWVGVYAPLILVLATMVGVFLFVKYTGTKKRVVRTVAAKTVTTKQASAPVAKTAPAAAPQQQKQEPQAVAAPAAAPAGGAAVSLQASFVEFDNNMESTYGMSFNSADELEECIAAWEKFLVDNNNINDLPTIEITLKKIESLKAMRAEFKE